MLFSLFRTLDFVFDGMIDAIFDGMLDQSFDDIRRNSLAQLGALYY